MQLTTDRSDLFEALLLAGHTAVSFLWPLVNVCPSRYAAVLTH